MRRQGQDRDSTVYVFVDITVDSGVSLVGDACNVAFTAVGVRPQTTDWVAAEIIAGNTLRVLVGNYNNTVGILLENIATYPAKFDVWVDIVDSPERPKEPVGTWTVT